MNRPIVVKFGGTCLSTAEARKRSASVVYDLVRGESSPVVVVVSAMGRLESPYSTDSLLGLLEEAGTAPERERAVVASCGEALSAGLLAAILAGMGIPAASLLGFQAGILTDERPTDARIAALVPARIRSLLEQGVVPVVAGFQGLAPSGDVTTLSRGGSDTTAVALGAALGASEVRIYTDVGGVMTADPRVVRSASRVERLTYEEVAELAGKGAKVLHPEAAELARRGGVALRVLGLETGEHSSIGAGNSERSYDLVSVTSQSPVAQVRVDGDLSMGRPAGAARILGAIAAAGVSLDMIDVQADRLCFTLQERWLDTVRAALKQQPGIRFSVRSGCAKVTLVGAGMHGRPGIVFGVVDALAQAGIDVFQSVDSNTTVSVLVDGHAEAAAVRAVHDRFFGASEGRPEDRVPLGQESRATGKAKQPLDP